MSKTNIGLAEHAKAQIGLPYWYGTFGSICNESLWIRKKIQYPSHYPSSRYSIAKSEHFGKRTYDCCGLIKSYMFQNTPTSSPKYSAAYDKNVGGLLSSCKKTGNMSSMPEIAGILVFRNTAHVGVYIGKGYVVEAKGFNYGVVKTKLSDSEWTKWGQLGWITYSSVSQNSNTLSPSPSTQSLSLKSFLNTSGKELVVYADTAKMIKIGSLFKDSSCSSFGETKGLAVLLYQISGTSTYKVGFTDYVKGIKA